MNQIFPYANIIAGVLVLIVGFIFHWVGQLICLINWELATKIGFAEKGMIPEYRVYEEAIAVADVLIGWIYGIAGIGLILGTTWGFKLAWFPGVILVYHSLSVWFWTNNQRKAGHRLMSDSARIIWSLANFITGILAILIAWHGA
ncbi:MAG: hypothetical protein GTO17_12030 [Candidatus Aminicenantes bacterium]|nr:hypothetical protein [Candidatus Aminicenantes bacterium]